MLVERDIGKGDVCAIIMRHNRILYPLYLAIVCVGAIPAVLHIRIRVCIPIIPARYRRYVFTLGSRLRFH